ncbi:MAG: hypothetical protein SAL07_04410 [Oscillatoria sp. PMC 1051.18]|nr:hypothetical protein [Oscillatoria sp. PMC 1050.18]MEC5029135.1 hypothetical protein [Oscillatoria sp. PMC 1051.18]
MIADAGILALPKVLLSVKELLPELSGIYYVVDENNTIWYIGKAKNINKRWQGKGHHRIYQLEAQKQKHFTIYYEAVSQSELDRVEKQRISKYHPHLNSSPVKTKNVRPTETLLRETLAKIAEFAFILGVEPPRQEVESQITFGWLTKKKVLGLSVIHICLDLATLKNKFQSESIEEEEALIKKSFSTRKSYASKWESFPPRYPFMYRLYAGGYAIEVNYWSWWYAKELPEIREYQKTTLAQQDIRALTPNSLAQLTQQVNKTRGNTQLLARLVPYHLDLIEPVFNEPVDSASAKKQLQQVSNDYKTGKRGIGSRSRPIKSKPLHLDFTTLEELLLQRGIDPKKYSRGGVINLPGSGDRMGLFLHCFSSDLKITRQYRIDINNQQFPIYNSAEGILNNKKIRATTVQFETVYLLASVEKKAWLLVEEYLKDFAKPATHLSNGEGFVDKFYVSPRKFIVPAKVNVKLENMGYGAWIPFGTSDAFPSFQSAKEEIRKRLENSGLKGLKLSFKQESIHK